MQPREPGNGESDYDDQYVVHQHQYGGQQVLPFLESQQYVNESTY